MFPEQGSFKTDLEKHYLIELGVSNPCFLKKLRLFIVHFGLHCVLIYRFGRYAKYMMKKNRLLGYMLMIPYYFMNYFIKMVHHVNIGDADIGPGLYISHLGTIYINNIKIGRNFSITHNVTIGVGHRFGKVGIPREIGDNVWIGTGSVISGDISIGDNVTISSGCILTKSIPSGCLTGGNPGRVILREYDNSVLFGNRGSEVKENR